MGDVGTRMELLYDSSGAAIGDKFARAARVSCKVPYLVRYLAQHQACATEHGKAGKSA